MIQTSYTLCIKLKFHREIVVFFRVVILKLMDRNCPSSSINVKFSFREIYYNDQENPHWAVNSRKKYKLKQIPESSDKDYINIKTKANRNISVFTHYHLPWMQLAADRLAQQVNLAYGWLTPHRGRGGRGILKGLSTPGLTAPRQSVGHRVEGV